MNDLSIFPADIAEMSVSQLANLPAQQLVAVHAQSRASVYDLSLIPVAATRIETIEPNHGDGFDSLTD